MYIAVALNGVEVKVVRHAEVSSYSSIFALVVLMLYKELEAVHPCPMCQRPALYNSERRKGH